MNKEQLQLEGIARQVQKLREGQSSIDALLAHTRASEDLRRQLPPAFSTVLDNLTDRLQASALFTEESCSFSRQDLLDSLQLWLDKARERVDRQAD
jgi:hypothetical protein